MKQATPEFENCGKGFRDHFGVVDGEGWILFQVSGSCENGSRGSKRRETYED